jgi:hypothetical protein
MTSGLRLLPRVQADRQRQRDEGSPFADEYMDCTSCKAKPDHASFAPEWRCGWLASDAWRDGGTSPHSEDVCPGYAIQLPEVIEAARLLQWRDHGSLAALVEELPLPPAAALSIDVLAGSIREVEGQMIREAGERGRRGTQ